MKRAVGDEATVIPIRSGGTVVESNDDQSFATIYGINRPGAAYTAAEGRLPDRLRQGAVVGAGLASSLDISVGQTVEIEGEQIRVIAILESQETFSPVAPDSAVILPESAFQSDGYDQVLLRAGTGEEAQLAADNVRETLNSRQQRVEIFELAEITNEIQEFFDLLGSFLLGLGGISLVVAGVSIFNVMLMSTVERRGEIGVMRAVGIEKRDVMRMLLSEAGLIGAAGGVTGVILTALVVVGLVTATPAERSMVLVTQNVWYLLLALGFGITVGIVSGLYPAWKAANERPVTALRE
jgi:ABC-type transport system, involved in lipoprotein release, permease component